MQRDYTPYMAKPWDGMTPLADDTELTHHTWHKDNREITHHTWHKDNAERLHTIHGKAMEWDDPVGGVDDGELFHPQLPADVGLGGSGAALGEVLQNHCVPRKRQQHLKAQSPSAHRLHIFTIILRIK